MVNNQLYAWFVVILYAITYNEYFGWNRFAQSDAEIICDGIFALGALLAVMIGNKNHE